MQLFIILINILIKVLFIFEFPVFVLLSDLFFFKFQVIIHWKDFATEVII